MVTKPTCLTTIPTRELQPTFQPLPLLGNRHVQTILGTLWKGWPRPFPTREWQVTLPDGDRLVVHDSEPSGWRPDRPMVVMVHGLGGSHQSGYLLRLANLLLPQGLRVLRLDLRGAGKGAGLARSSYNGGCSMDVRSVLQQVHQEAPQAPLFLVGFSLGGNIVLKLAGEATDDPIPGLAGIATLAPPIDLVRCAELLSLRSNRLYDRHFAHGLRRQVRLQEALFPDLARTDFPRRLTLRLFDELYTAPRGGFRNALDYYEQSSSAPRIPRIEQPTLILTARDDPFIAVDAFERLPHQPNLEVHLVSRGGHLGFLGPDGAGGYRWAERRLADWLLRACS